MRGKHLAKEKMAKVNQIFGNVIKYELGLKPDDAEAKIPTEAHIDLWSTEERSREEKESATKLVNHARLLGSQPRVPLCG